MEMPMMIMEEVKRLEHNERIDAKCEIVFNVNESKYMMEIFPWKSNCIYIRFNETNFKCNSYERYEEIMKYMINYFLERDSADVCNRCEWDSYNPDDDENYNKLAIRVNSKEKQVFFHYYNDINNKDIIDYIYKDLKIMYYMAIL